VPEAHQQTFNVGADEAHSVLDLADEVAAALGVEPRVEHLPPRKEVVHAFASHDKARRVFGRTAPIPLREGLRRMARWVKARGPTPPVEFKDIEVPINLPPSWAKTADSGPGGDS